MRPSRDFAVAVFVVWCDSVLLHHHPKLGKWLPVGGHIEPDELPDEAAVREAFEESGIRVQLSGDRALPVDEPKQLIRPEGIQLERIGPEHEHIDLIYFGRPVEPYGGEIPVADAETGWYDIEAVETLPLTQEVRAWCRRALTLLAG